MLLTVVFWAYNFVALKQVYQQIDASVVAVVRCVVMWAALYAIGKLMGLRLKYRRDDFWWLMGLGALSMGVYIVFFLEGMRLATPAEGAIILSTSPIFTALFAYLFRQERFSWGALGGAVLAFIGVAVVVFFGPYHLQGNRLGGVLILCSSILWALSTVVMRRVVEDRDPFEALTLSMPGALPILIPYGLLDFETVWWRFIEPVTWIALLHVIFLAGVVGFLGFYKGVKQIGASGTMLYQFLVPPLATAFGFVFLRQIPTIGQGFGFAIVIAGVWYAARSRMRAEARARRMELATEGPPAG